MSRPVTRPITRQFVLRTLKRVEMIASRIDAKTLANLLPIAGRKEQPKTETKPATQPTSRRKSG